MRIKYILLLIFAAVFVVSCGSKKKVVTKKKNDSGPHIELPETRDNTHRELSNQKIEILEPSARRYSVEDYIKDFSGIAQEEMRLYNIPASITLAQGILESGAGQGDLSRRANNHFGIKCHDWDGPRVYHDDDARGECFRKYKDARYSYRDHSLFLTERARYASLFDLSTDDYKAWARGLRKAGYATDRKYPEKLIGIIERYELYRYDADVLKRPSPSYTHNPEPSELTYRVEKGDTLYGIAKRYNISVEDLQRYNDLKDANLAVGQILYIISPSEY
ncbi:glucosaminidase domain-containing protein [Salegentibacter sediminis]|uniref:glucosaminidase domain-containing protein n=1 Tax=Salegentibacter sediminis TaxID=1930251 RepID=UPI0009BF8775|nr:glucosaminidase domain-containing protein [Salegentibacter sediminis]